MSGGRVSKFWMRPQTWFLAIVGAVSAVIAAVGGLHVYMTATATPLHRDAGKVPSTVRPATPTGHADAVERARQAVRAAIAGQNLPGLSVAVGMDGDLVWAEGFGWADLEDRVPVTPDTRFRIGTASTVLTSAAAGLLVEQGTLKLDEPIQTYVPAFPKKKWPVTLRQVMGHTAGLGSDGGDEGPLYGQHCERPADALTVFGDDELRFEPGTRYRFSTYDWILVSAAIEKAAGQPFLSVMRRLVFEPLGMNDTKADSATDAIANRTTPYFPRYSADPRYGLDITRDLDLSCYAGSSVFLSTPSDLVRFGLAIGGGKLLQPATIQVLQTSQRTPAGETGYGLGWDLETVTLSGTPTPTAGHDGTILGGPLASLMTFRDRGLVVAVVSNTSYADTFAIASSVAQAFAGPAQTPGSQ
jgi:CubicO group peptidase (beta-lactamase class C family)